MATDEKSQELENTNETSTETIPAQDNQQELTQESLSELKVQPEASAETIDEATTEASKDREFAEALEENLTVEQPEKGSKIKGTIIIINDDGALIDCGAKSEALLGLDELNGHKIGDEVEGLVLSIDPFIISAKLDSDDTTNEEFKSAFDNGVPVSGKITREIKGGFDVDVAGTRAFLPISHLDASFIKDTKPFIGQTYDFKIIEYSDNGRQFVVSRAEILKKERMKQAEKLWDSITVGDIMEGTVRSIQNFGAFIDLGGIEGLLHISELSNDYTTHPSDILSVGDTIKVSILAADQEKNRISLSMKDLAPDPWASFGKEIVAGDKFSGTVVRKAEFGLFIQLAPGIDGLLHLSQIKQNTGLDDAEYAIGQKIEGWVRSIDLDNKRVGLTLHEMPSDDPWATISQNFQVDAVYEGTIEESTQFGVFVELQPGLTGLMPLSELKKLGYKNVDTEFTAQNKIKVKITAIDENRQRISLLPDNVPEHIVAEAAKTPRKKMRPKRKEKVAEMQNGSNDGGSVTAFGELLAAALHKTDD